jgi:hypothetical protein
MAKQGDVHHCAGAGQAVNGAACKAGRRGWTRRGPGRPTVALSLVGYGKLQVRQAAQVQPGAAWATHHPQQDLVARRTAGDHARGLIEHPHLGHRPGPAAVAAAADGHCEVAR